MRYATIRKPLTDRTDGMNNERIIRITVSGVFIAIGVLIPMFSPVRLILEPASYTLAIHVPIFVAMFISPYVAVSVAVGTAIGFQLGGFPPVVVVRAMSHVVFVIMGVLFLYFLNKRDLSNVSLRLYSFSIACLHALGEIAAVTPFYFGGGLTGGFYEKGFLLSEGGRAV